MRSLARLTLFATLVASALLAGRLAVAFDGLPACVLLVAAAGCALLATDAISGIVHWGCDTYFAEDTPVLGPLLIGPFREHHRDPLAMTRRDPLELNVSNAMSALPVLAATVAWADPQRGPATFFACAFGLFLAHAITWTNQIHAWAHLAEVPTAVRGLQRLGVVISPERHARHHVYHREAYCITTGWLNPPLDASAAFPRAERAVAWLVQVVRRLRIGHRRKDRSDEVLPVAAER